jgi:hypothetical protein
VNICRNVSYASIKFSMLIFVVEGSRMILDDTPRVAAENLLIRVVCSKRTIKFIISNGGFYEGQNSLIMLKSGYNASI